MWTGRELLVWGGCCGEGGGAYGDGAALTQAPRAAGGSPQPAPPEGTPPSPMAGGRPPPGAERGVPWTALAAALATAALLGAAALQRRRRDRRQRSRG